MEKNIYLNCGIYTNDNQEILFIAVPGYFASSAWCMSDDAYYDTLGAKFEGITADDGLSWTLDRNKIRRLSDTDNLDDLLNNACDDFKKIFNKKFNYEITVD